MSGTHEIISDYLHHRGVSLQHVFTDTLYTIICILCTDDHAITITPSHTGRITNNIQYILLLLLQRYRLFNAAVIFII